MQQNEPITSEAILVLSLKEGNLKAFSELFDRYAKRLQNFSMGYLKSVENAEEIVQDVFMKIWNIREELTVEKSFESYLGSK